MSDKPQIGKFALYGIMLGMLACGTCNTLVMKIQDDTSTTFNGVEYPFSHPYL
jgi:drug/metabolite transporter (DMT)-like permease